MKLTIPQLREIVQRALKEAKGIQGVYRRSYDKMIKKASTGGNKNTPPFTKKAAKAGKSGLGPF
jgi:3'-phosphoadenosine 5'-phosphosulfate sulfotransferase